MLDLLLGTLLLLSALASMHSRDTLRSGVFFLSFGLISGLVWVRLSAPDVAMVEIILGAGITGVLVFRLMKGVNVKSVRVPAYRKLWAGVVSFLFFLWMLPYIRNIPVEVRVSALVSENLPLSGVESPVTAVLLNFRGYDTLLEVGVITLATFGVLAIGTRREVYLWKDPILQSVSKHFFPLVAFFSLYITYLGALSVGGAFQGGALLAGGLVLLALSGQAINFGRISGLLLLLSLVIFLGVGTLYAITGNGFLTFPIDLATPSIILIELSIWLSTAVLLYTAYRGRL
ncbi:MAG: DUF4040 domain-containing protein [Aquificota bacterium]|jgi:multisubunit Na+/H+ antiporter MnhB subunit|nr:MAG: DUF4040 domain-containing protein [Aquificota bacterium]